MMDMHTPAKQALAAVLLVTGVSSQAMEVTISGGQTGRPASPVCFKADKPFSQGDALAVSVDGAKPTPAQADHQGRLWWWAGPVQPRQSATCRIEKLTGATPAEKVKVAQVKDDLVNVTIDGQLFTALNFKKDEAKPYLYPLIGPTGEAVTRDYPMKDNPAEKNYKGKNRQDHPHHQSLWTAYGDVRSKDLDKPGSNYWDQTKPQTVGRQKVTRVTRLVSGPVFGQIEADIDWVGPSGQREFSETRTYTFFCGNQDNRIVDVQNAFKFSDGDVMFADTKEGGILAVRVAVTMDELGDGQMTNAQGQVGEKQCWGQAAPWCDYVGPVNGQTVGIATFDAKTNFRHPTTWHIRGYGLLAANPFGLGAFTKGKQNGAHAFKKGAKATFDYRVVIHKGDTKTARIADQYDLYAAGPMAIHTNK